MKYRVLYLLQSATLILFEIQRLDQPPTAPPSQRYQWLRYEPAANQLTPLTFNTMQSTPPFEERQFAEGSLRFSNIEGVFLATGTTKAVALSRNLLLELPPRVAEQLKQL